MELTTNMRRLDIENERLIEWSDGNEDAHEKSLQLRNLCSAFSVLLLDAKHGGLIHEDHLRGIIGTIDDQLQVIAAHLEDQNRFFDMFGPIEEVPSTGKEKLKVVGKPKKQRAA